MEAPVPLVRADFRERVHARREQLGCCWPTELREPLQAHLRELVAPALLGTRVPLERLARILADGRFRTSHEPGGQPSKNPPRSPAQEARVWNIAESALADMPIYGYLATLADVTSIEARASLHQAYGSARVLLADEVRSRSTVFFADSRWPLTHEEGAPAPVDESDELAWLPDRGDPRARGSIDVGVFDEVVETQIIGGIHAREIETVIFDCPPPASIKQALCSREIEWDVNPLPEMSAEQQARFVADRLAGAE
jgi:hypothetical protein